MIQKKNQFLFDSIKDLSKFTLSYRRHDAPRVKDEPRRHESQSSINDTDFGYDIPAPPSASRRTSADTRIHQPSVAPPAPAPPPVIPPPTQVSPASDEIVLLKKVRKRGQKTVVEIDDDDGGRSRRIKLERNEPSVKKELLEIITSSISTSTVAASTPSQFTAPTPSTQPSVSTMQFPTTSSTQFPITMATPSPVQESPDTTNMEIPLVGMRMPCKSEPLDDTTINEENILGQDK